MVKRILRALWTCIAVLESVSGCSRAPVAEIAPVTPVRGKVLYRGHPAAGAAVFLVPASTERSNVLRPRGVSGQDGGFRLSTYKRSDGAPAGEYQVAVTWRGPRRNLGDPEEENPPMRGMGPLRGDYLKGRYSNPKTSGLRVLITAGAAEIPPIQLK